MAHNDWIAFVTNGQLVADIVIHDRPNHRGEMEAITPHYGCVEHTRIIERRAHVPEPQRLELEPAATGHDGKPWPQTTDGMAWAIEFNKRFPAVAVDDALGWFCNAIMLGIDHRKSVALTASFALSFTDAHHRAIMEGLLRARAEGAAVNIAADYVIGALSEFGVTRV